MSTQKIELAAMNCHHRFYELEISLQVQKRMDISM